MRTLEEYLSAIKDFTLEKRLAGNPAIEGVTNNSRATSKNFAFTAIKGAKADGHKYVADAISRGAVAIFHTEDLPACPDNVSLIRVSDAYLVHAALCEAFYDFPSRNLRLVGVTGTNGKTTIAYLTQESVNRLGGRCGLISTVSYSFGDFSVEASRTTPEAHEIQELFHRMRSAGCDTVAMEASSHGLDQHRLGLSKFKVAVFTNLTGDHLDYHLTMDNYFQAKRRLFTEYLADDGAAVVNIDDEHGRILASELAEKKLLTYGKDPAARCRILDLRSDFSGSKITFSFDGKKHEVQTGLIGEHNAHNLAAVICALHALGFPVEAAMDVASQQQPAPGRLEMIPSPNGAAVYVDYAHTDDALENVLRAVKPLCKGRVITLFGCGGDRDKTKRPRMAKVSSELSDFTIITSDNPRSEDPLAIIEDIKKGLVPGAPHIAEPDRKKAIFKAVSMSKAGDIVLLAGKGHETSQITGDVSEPFDDRAVARDAVAAL